MKKHTVRKIHTYCHEHPIVFAFWAALATLISTFLLFLVVVSISSHVYAAMHKNEPRQWGASFSVKHANDIGLNWRQAFTEITNELNLKKIRLMSYWDLIEPVPGYYLFHDLDWQMDEAQRKGIKVSLAIGIRQPRWPECHEPDWAKPLITNKDYDALYAYMTAVVERYRNHPALESYQLENEALLRVFGECVDFNQDRLHKEMEMVRQLDPNHPIYMSLNGQTELPTQGPYPDAYGYSIYRRNWVKEAGFYVDYPYLPSWYSGRGQLIKWYTGKPVFIHELQLEPWGPRQAWEILPHEQDYTMSVSRLRTTMKYARETEIKEIYLWGSEWWYWRKTVMNDPSIWNAVQEELKK